MDNIEQARDLVVYVLLRTDIPSLNPGKAAAQVHHAGVQMMAKFGDHRLVTDYLNDGMKNGASGFNTTLVLGATAAEIHRVCNAAQMGGHLNGKLIDPEYPFFVDAEASMVMEALTAGHLTPGIKKIKDLDNGKALWVRSELTCAWFLGDRNDPVFKALFDGLNLHP